MRRLVAVVLALCALSLFGPVRALAQDATPAPGEVTALAPDASFGGATIGEWNARWFQWAFSFPAEVNPNTDPADDRCGYGQAGPVFFLPANFGPPGPTAACVVPEGVAIYLPLGGSNCSTVEPPPFFGRDEAELRACAAAAVEADHPIADQAVRINGQEVPDLASYRSSSPLTPIVFAADNIFGAPAGAALFVNDAYSLLIAPPAPGTYEIDVSIGPDVVVTYRVSVVAPQVITPEATPDASPAATPAASPAAAASCLVDPRPLAEVLDLWAAATPGAGMEAAPITFAELPEGAPADAETVAAIEQVARQWNACSAAGDTLRAWALTTDDFIRLQAPPPDEAVEGISFATPGPDEVIDPFTISGASEARVLADGRVGALFTIQVVSGPSAGLSATLFIVFEQQDEGWLIDAVSDLVPGGEGGAG